MAARKPTTIDEYLAGVKGEKRAALDKLRKTIRSIVPKAEECISYGIPAFRLDGRIVAGFAATKKGCSYFPFSGSTLKTLAKELEDYEQTKSSLHFDDVARHGPGRRSAPGQRRLPHRRYADPGAAFVLHHTGPPHHQQRRDARGDPLVRRRHPVQRRRRGRLAREPLPRLRQRGTEHLLGAVAVRTRT